LAFNVTAPCAAQRTTKQRLVMQMNIMEIKGINIRVKILLLSVGLVKARLHITF
jgi:hypothetical protein